MPLPSVPLPPSLTTTDEAGEIDTSDAWMTGDAGDATAPTTGEFVGDGVHTLQLKKRERKVTTIE